MSLEHENEQEKEFSVLDDLFDFLNEEEKNAYQISEEPGFTIETTDQANYFARKLREVREQKKEFTDAAEHQIQKYTERVRTWESKSVAPLEYEEQRLINMLEFFATKQLEGSTKKSIKLVEGTLQFRAQQPSIEYNDETLLPYVEKNIPDAIAIKKSVSKKELKSAVEFKNGLAYYNGQAVPGITVEDRPAKFDVK